MRRAQFVLLASMLTTAGVTLAACGSDVSQNSGSGGSTTSASSTGSSGGSGGGGGIMDAGSDVDNGHPSKNYPAPHPPPPNVINCTGTGPVLSAPSVVPIFFPADTLQSQLADFVNTVGATPYWTANVQEYGVGALTSQAPITLTETAPTTTSDDEIQQWLAQHLDGTLQPQFPAPDANTIYAIFYPDTTSISMSGGGGTSCQSFGGYHNSISYMSSDVAYAVLPRCHDFDGLHGIDAVTAAASHELIEGTTDPYPGDQNNAAFCQVDNNHIYWLFALGGGETGDMCAQDLSSFTKFPPFAYEVQRSWSNISANQGHDPCVPIPKGNPPYFNSAPVLPDMLNIVGTNVPGKRIAVGETGVIEVDLFSDGDTGGPWTVDAQDFSQVMGQGHELDFQWDRISGQNGEKLHLSVTVEQASQFGAEIFFITSQLNGQQHFWVGLVGQ